MPWNKPSPDDGAWIFLSHSHLDWDAVRRVRNYLEDLGHRPLVFFLKSMDDSSELADLIRREIKARTWFLLCDSKNARASRWVQDELAMVRSMEDKKLETVDTSKPFKVQIRSIRGLSRRVTIFLSHARANRAMALLVSMRLRTSDFRVLEPESQTDKPFGEVIRDALTEATQNGFFVTLLSQDSVRSEFVRAELRVALEMASTVRGRSIVPVFIEDRRSVTAAMSPDLQLLLAGIQSFELSVGDFDTQMKILIRDLKARDIG